VSSPRTLLVPAPESLAPDLEDVDTAELANLEGLDSVRGVVMRRGGL
jgi:hypothetical protein